MLKWIVERLDGQAAAMPSAIGNLATRESFDVSGMDLDHRRRQRPLTIDIDVWAHETALIKDPPRSAPTCPRRCGTCTTPYWTGSRETVPPADDPHLAAGRALRSAACYAAVFMCGPWSAVGADASTVLRSPCRPCRGHRRRGGPSRACRPRPPRWSGTARRSRRRSAAPSGSPWRDRRCRRRTCRRTHRFRR